MTRMRTALTLAAAALLAALPPTAAQAEPRLVFDAATTHLAVGESFELLLRGEGFDVSIDGRSIYRFSGGQQLGLGFTAGQLELVSVTIDPRWSYTPARRSGLIDNTAGTLSGLSFGSFPATTDDSFPIVRLGFRALASGPADIELTGVDLIGQLNGQAGVKFGVEAVGMAVNISAVPEPHAALMAALGLCGVLLQRRRAAAERHHG